MHAEKLLEPEIKAIVLNHLKENGRISEDTSIINEFTIDNYSRRVDLALANQNHLIAFEIKSEADSLFRLEGQVEKYLEYFDKVVIVAASKHIKSILQTAPKNVAIWEINKRSIAVRRRGKIEQIKNKEKLINLMKANELIKLSNQLGLSTKSKDRRTSEFALQNAPICTLREAALNSIKKRFLKTYSSFWQHARNTEIEPQHIDLLSPYKEGRESLKIKDANKQAFWENLFSRDYEDPNLAKLSQKRDEPIFGQIPKEIKHLITI